MYMSCSNIFGCRTLILSLYTTSAANVFPVTRITYNTTYNELLVMEQNSNLSRNEFYVLILNVVICDSVPVPIFIDGTQRKRGGGGGGVAML